MLLFSQANCTGAINQICLPFQVVPYTGKRVCCFRSTLSPLRRIVSSWRGEKTHNVALCRPLSSVLYIHLTYSVNENQGVFVHSSFLHFYFTRSITGAKVCFSQSVFYCSFLKLHTIVFFYAVLLLS